MKSTIFIKKYRNEDSLTESLMVLLSSVEPSVLNIILKRISLRYKSCKNPYFQMQPCGPDCRPDAVIEIGETVIYIEVKKDSKLWFLQLARHARFLAKHNLPHKYLLVITKDSIEPHEIVKKWRNSGISKVIEKRFVSWSQIWEAVKHAKNGRCNLKDRYLMQKFTEYLYEEGVINMTSPLKANDGKRWTEFNKWAKDIEEYLKHDVENYIKWLRPAWIKSKFMNSSSDIRCHYRTLGKGNYMHFYAGFYAGDDSDILWQHPSFYVGWRIRGCTAKIIENTSRFSVKEKWLLRNKFIHWRSEGKRSFYKLLKLTDIGKKKTIDAQKAYIRGFINNSINLFDKSKLHKLM